MCNTGNSPVFISQTAGISRVSIACSSARREFSFEEQFALWQNSDSSKVTYSYLLTSWKNIYEMETHTVLRESSKIYRVLLSWGFVEFFVSVFVFCFWVVFFFFGGCEPEVPSLMGFKLSHHLISLNQTLRVLHSISSNELPVQSSIRTHSFHDWVFFRFNLWCQWKTKDPAAV